MLCRVALRTLCSYSHEPRTDVYCFRLNFNISKLVYYKQRRKQLSLWPLLVKSGIKNTAKPALRENKLLRIVRCRRQRGRVVSASDSQSSGPRFESRSDYYLGLFLGSPGFKSSATLANSQLVCLRPLGILNMQCYVQFEIFVSVCSAPLALVL